MIDKNVFKDILPFKKHLCLILISDTVQAVMAAAASYVIAYVADRLLSAQIDISAAAPFLVLLLFFLTAKAILAHYNRIKAEKISQIVQGRLRLMLLTVLSARTQLDIQKKQGQWLALVMRGVDRLDVYITVFLPQLGLLITFPIVLLCCAFYNDWISGLIFLGTAPLIPLFMVLIGKLADKENKRQWQLFEKLAAYLSDLLPGLLVLKAYNQAQNQVIQAAKNGEMFSRATLKVLRIAFLSAFMLEFIATLSIAVIAVNIGLRLVYGQAQFLPVFFMLLIAPQYYQPFRQFGAAFHDAMNGMTAASEIYSLQQKLAQVKKYNNNKSNLKQSAFESKPPQICFEDVHYSYKNGRGLKGLSFTVPSGSLTVIAGANGAGKSTALKLLLKLRQADSGRITVNGCNLKDINKADWRLCTGWAAQEPYVFAASFKDNIALGRPCTDEMIKEAAHRANLADFIESLPEGYDAVLGKTVKLSSGQKRRLGLARALFGTPHLLVLDEPMENLDSVNEELIQSVLDEMHGKVTVVIIAHRLRTIKRADHVILIGGGRLLEEGSPAQLEQNGSVYAHLLAGQKRGQMDAQQ